MDKLKKILKKLKGAFSKLNDLRKELKDEVSLYWKNEKENIISFFVCLGFIIFILAMMLFVFFYIRTFLTILLTFFGIVIMFLVEVGLEKDNDTPYPLLRKIKNGLIRSIVYPIALLLIGLSWYALLFH